MANGGEAVVSRTSVIARRYMIALVVAGVAVAGCSSSSKSSSSTTPTVASAGDDRRAGNPAAGDDRWRTTTRSTLPATLPSGYVDVTLENHGKQDHQIAVREARLDSTYDAFKTAAITTEHRRGQAGRGVRGRPQRRGAGQVDHRDREARSRSLRGHVLHPRHRRQAARRARDDRRGTSGPERSR